MDFNGCPPHVSKATRRYIKRGQKLGLVVTATTNGKHATYSYHYPSHPGGPGRAGDMGLIARLIGTLTGKRRLERFQRREARWPNRRRYLELFGPVNDRCVKNGRLITLAEGTVLEQLHDNHVHGAARW